MASTNDLRPAESLTIQSIRDLKREVERTRLEWFNHNISYANGIACALSKIEKFEASVEERLKEVIKLSKKSNVQTSTIVLHELELELRRILGEEVKE